ncbi:MAG: pantetheine-phosphate adenylyltransferase [Candidatus Poseidoniaceae archaeon]
MTSTGGHARCLLGGTFDRLHDGHKDLLYAGLEAASHLEVHVTTDHMAQAKDHRIQSMEERMAAVEGVLRDVRGGGWSLHMLNDAFGPAPTHATADALVVSPETRTGGEAINRKRLETGLAALTLIEVPHRRNAQGTILSSTAIRNGSMDVTGQAWISDAWRTHVMAMSPAAETHLKTPSGTPYRGPEDNPEVAMSAVLDDLSSLDGPLIAVGDVTARVMLELDTVPDLALIDGQTKRVALDDNEAVDLAPFPIQMQATSPPGVLTPNLLAQLELALHAEEPCVMVVDGEEDMAPLYLHLLAPLGAIVVFGMPGWGLMVQRTTIEMKERCRTILNAFEVR